MMQVTKVWWDGENLMAEPIDPTTIYQEPAQQETVKVGRITDNIKGMVLRQEVMLYTDDYLPIGTALYTSPPAQRTWVGLSDLDIDELENEYMKSAQTAHQFLRAIEAKLKEKNT